MTHAIDYKRLAERALIYRLITEVYPTGIVSLVSDTFDFWGVMTEDTKILKPVIMAREGKVVFRPDSGDPVDIICGTARDITNGVNNWKYYKKVDLKDKALLWGYDNKLNEFKYEGVYYARTFGEKFEVVENPTPEMKGAVECLWEIFGGTTTEKGFKTLDSHVGLIYGDSINLDRAQRILEGLKAKGFSSANIVFGIGSFTYQFVTRDTMGEAVKATFGIVNGEEREIFKAPKTGDGMKNSAKGLLRVEYDPNTKDFTLYDQQTWEQEEAGELTALFTNSTMLRLDSLDNMRNRLYNSI